MVGRWDDECLAAIECGPFVDSDRDLSVLTDEEQRRGVSLRRHGLLSDHLVPTEPRLGQKDQAHRRERKDGRVRSVDVIDEFTASAEPKRLRTWSNRP